MRILLSLTTAVTGAFVLVAAAVAAPPVHETYTDTRQFVDTDICAFPVAGDVTFTNDATIFFDNDGVIRELHLHQTTVGTLSAQGTTLKLHITETIMVAFAGGVPAWAKHVGLLNSIVGPGGPVFHRTGQAAFESVLDPASGFYVDGPLLARHGLRDDFDPVEFCAAFP